MKHSANKPVLPMASIGLSTIAIAVVLLSTWSSDPLAAYDFSSPENAMRSGWQMRADMDMDAIAVRTAHLLQDEYAEKLQSIRISHVVEYGGCKGVFYSSTYKGTPDHRVGWYEKDSASGQWLPNHKLGFTAEIADKELKAQVYDWWAMDSGNERYKMLANQLRNETAQ